MPSFPSYSTTRRVCQVALASSTLILLHSLLIAGTSIPCALASDSSQKIMTIKEEVRFQGTLVVISMLWMVFGLLEERSDTALHVEGGMEETYQPVLTSIAVEWVLLTFFNLEWIAHLGSSSVMYQAFPGSALFPATAVAVLSMVIVHSALSIRILIEICFVPRVWRSASFWTGDVTKYAWYQGNGHLEIKGGEEKLSIGEGELRV